MTSRLLRIAGIAIVVLVLIVGAGIGYLTANPAALREPVLQALSGAVKGEVTAEGAVSLTFLPSPGLSIEGVSVTIAPPESPHGEVTAERLTARLDLMAYLGGTLRLSSIEAEGVTGDLSLAEDDGGAPAAPSTASVDLPSVTLGIDRLSVTLPDREPLVLEGAEIALALSAEGLGLDALRESLALDLQMRVPAFAPAGKDGPQLSELDLSLERPAGGDATVALSTMAAVPGKALSGPARVEMDAVVAGGGERISLDRLVLGLTEGTIEGVGGIDFAPGRPVMDLVLTAGTLDFSHLFPAGERAAGPMIPDIALPSVAPPLDGEISLTAETLRLGGIGQLEAVAATVALDPDLVTVTEIRAERGAGTVSATGSVDFAGAAPALEIELDAERMPVADWIQPAQRIDLRETALSIDASLAGSGSDLRSLVGDATGRVSTGATGGRVRIGLLPAGAGGIDRALGGMLSRQESMQLYCYNADWVLDGGVATSRGLVVSTEALTIAGGGAIDLLAETLAMDLAVEPAAASLLPAATSLRVRGPIKSPQVTPRPIGAATTALSVAAAPVNPLGILAQIEGAPAGSRGLGACRTAVREGAGSTSVPQRLAPLLAAPETLIDEGKDAIKGVGRSLRSLFD